MVADTKYGYKPMTDPKRRERPKSDRQTRNIRFTPEVAAAIDALPWGRGSEEVDKACRKAWGLAETAQ